MTRRVLIIAVYLAGVSPTLSIAGAWVQPPGRTYARLVYASLESRTRFDAEGRKIGLEGPGFPARDTEYSTREIRVYCEHGLASRITAYGSLAYKKVRIVEPRLFLPQRVIPEAVHKTSGVGDLILGGRFLVLPGTTPVSLAAEIKIPAGYNRRANPALGNGNLDATIRALAGASANIVYVTSDVAWTRRGGAFQDQVGFSLELGGKILGFYTCRGVLSGIRSLGAAASPPGSPIFDPALASPRGLALSGVLGANVLGAFDLEFGLSRVLSGRNVLAGNTLEVGLAFTGAPR